MPARIAATLSRYPWLVDETDGVVAGYAYAGIALPNPASGLDRPGHEAAGFEPIGVCHGEGFKHGHWIDVSWWHLLLQPPPPDPAPPIPFPELDG